MDGGLHLRDVTGVGAQQNTLRQLVVLGLTKQVHGHPVGRRGAVGQHQNLAGAGNHVDAYRAKHAPLGGRHVGVARAGDFVHRRQGLGAIRQRGHGLRTAHREGTGDASHISRSQHQGIFLALRGRHDHDDFTHTGHVRGDGVHQHARRIGRLTPRHINTHTVQRRDLLAQEGAVNIPVAPAFATGFFLGLVVGAHALGSGLQRVALGGSERLESGFQLGLGQLQLGEAGSTQTVKARGVLQHSGVPALLHVQQNIGHPLLDGGIGFG